MSLTPFATHTSSLSSATFPPDGKDGKQPPVAPQAGHLGLIGTTAASDAHGLTTAPALAPPSYLSSHSPAEQMPQAQSRTPLRERLRHRDAQEAGETELRPKRRKAESDDHEAETRPLASDSSSSSNSVLARGAKRKDRKSQDPADEVQGESQPPAKPARGGKKQQASVAMADVPFMNRDDPAAEVRRLLGLPPSGAGPAPDPQFEPAIDAQLLGLALRKAFLYRQPGVNRLRDALSKIVPSLKDLPPKAFDVAVRAMGQVVQHRAPACRAVASCIGDWCTTLGDLGASFARILVGEIGLDRLGVGPGGSEETFGTLGTHMGQCPAIANKQVWRAFASAAVSAKDPARAIGQLVLPAGNYGGLAIYDHLAMACADPEVCKTPLPELLQRLRGDVRIRLAWSINEHTHPAEPVDPRVADSIAELTGRADLARCLQPLLRELSQLRKSGSAETDRAFGDGVARGLGGAAMSADSLDAILSTLELWGEYLRPARIGPFTDGFAAALGGTSLAQATLQQITRALSDIEISSLSDCDETPSLEQVRTSFRERLGAQRFDEAMAAARRPWDEPGAAAPAAPLLAADAGVRLAALRTAIEQLPQPPAVRPELPEVGAHDREAARLWLALDRERQALNEAGIPLPAEFHGALASLVAHLPAPDASITPDRVEQHVRQFEKRSTQDMDMATRTQDALVLGWRLGLGSEPGEYQPLARTALMARVKRLVRLAVRPRAGALVDPLLTGLLQAATKARDTLAPDRARMRRSLDSAFKELGNHYRWRTPEPRKRQWPRVIAAAEWVVRSAACVAAPAEVAAGAVSSLMPDSFHEPTFGELKDEHDCQAMAATLARAVDARGDDRALESLVVSLSAASPSHGSTIRGFGAGLLQVIGPGERLTKALRHVLALPFDSEEDRIRAREFIAGLCATGPRDHATLLKAGREFSPAQKVALMRRCDQIPWGQFTHDLAEGPPSAPILTHEELRQWTMAWSLATDGQDMSPLRVFGPLQPGAQPNPVRHQLFFQAVALAKEPVSLIRNEVSAPVKLSKEQALEASLPPLSHAEQLAWLEAIYSNKSRMPMPFVRRQLMEQTGLPIYSVTQAQAALQMESVFALLRHGADKLSAGMLRSARNFLLEQLRVIEGRLSLDEEGQPTGEDAALCIRASETIVGLYTPRIYGQATKLDWAFDPPPPHAPQASRDAFQAKAAAQLDRLRENRAQLQADIADLQARLDIETRRGHLKETLLAGEQPKSIREAAVELSRTPLLANRLQATIAAMKRLQQGLDAAVRAAGADDQPAVEAQDVQGLG